MPRSAHQRQLLTTLRDAFVQLRAPFAQLRTRVVDDATRHGTAGALRTFPHWYDICVAQPRRELFRRTATTIAHQRLTSIEQTIAQRYPHRRFPTSANSAHKAVHQALTRPRVSAGRAWHLGDMTWPVDRSLRVKFALTVDDWSRRARANQSITLHAAASHIAAALGQGKAPKITKPAIKYPFDDLTDVDAADLVGAALDDVVINRGEYYAAVGIRDLAREVDLLTARNESQRIPMIIGWRWTLSDAHTEEKCRASECLTYSTADVGHPAGGGVYFDLLFPQGHPNCWCNLEEVWAEDGDDANVPQPPDDYEDRVRALTEQFHDFYAAAA